MLNLFVAMLFYFIFKNSKAWEIQEIRLERGWHKWGLGISLISITVRLVEILSHTVPKSYDTFIHFRIASRILENIRPLESSIYYPLGMHGWILSWSTFADWREVILLSPMIGTVLWSVFSWFLVCRLKLPDIYKVMLIGLLNFTPFNPIAQHLAWSELPIPRIFVYSMFFFLLTLVLLPLKDRGSITIPAIILIGISFIHNLSALNFSLFLCVWLFSKIWQESGSKNLLLGLKSESSLIVIIFLTPLVVGSVAMHSNSIKFTPTSEIESGEEWFLTMNTQDSDLGFSILGNESYFELDSDLNWTSSEELPDTVKIIFPSSIDGRSTNDLELNIICSSPNELDIDEGKSSYSGTIDVVCMITDPSQNITLVFDTIEYNDVYDAEGLPPHATLSAKQSIPISLVSGHSQLIIVPIEAKSLPPDGSWSLRLNWGIGETNISISTGSYVSDVISTKSSFDLVLGFLSFKPNADFLKDNAWWITILSLMLIFVAIFSDQGIEIKSLAYSGIAMNFCLISGWLTYPADWGIVRLAHMQVIPMSLAITICGWNIYELFMEKIPDKYDNKNLVTIIFISILVVFGGHESYQPKISQESWDGALDAEPGHYYVSQNDGWLSYVNPSTVTFSSSEPLIESWGGISSHTVDERCYPNDLELLIEISGNNDTLSEWLENSKSLYPDRWTKESKGEGYEFWHYESSKVDGIINVSYDEDILVRWSGADNYSNIILVASGNQYHSATFYSNIIAGDISSNSEFKYWFCAPDDNIISPIFSIN